MNCCSGFYLCWFFRVLRQTVFWLAVHDMYFDAVGLNVNFHVVLICVCACLYGMKGLLQNGEEYGERGVCHLRRPSHRLQACTHYAWSDKRSSVGCDFLLYGALACGTFTKNDRVFECYVYCDACNYELSPWWICLTYTWTDCNWYLNIIALSWMYDDDFGFEYYLGEDWPMDLTWPPLDNEYYMNSIFCSGCTCMDYSKLL